MCVRYNILLTMLLVITPHWLLGQSKGENYIQERTFLDAAGNRCVSTLTYYDGIGRPVETASDKSGRGATVYSITTYDGAGRLGRTYLPVASGTSLDYLSADGFRSASSTYYGDNTAFTERQYGAQGELAGVSLAGREWSSRGKRDIWSHSANSTSDKVLHYEAPLGRNVLVMPDKTAYEYYPAGCLAKETATDADGCSVTVFKDIDGHTVLERDAAGDTYYVYNDIGQLRYVLSPMFQREGSIARFGYEYIYDDRGDLVGKTLPGCSTESYWYDREHRLAFLQDSRLRESGMYRFFIYDRLGRLAVQGLCKDYNHAIVSIDATAGYNPGQTGLLRTGYAPASPALINTEGAVLEKVCFYDSYGFLTGSLKNGYAPLSVPSNAGNGSMRLTGKAVRTSDGKYVYTVCCYDVKGNVTRTASAWDGMRIDDQDAYTFTGNRQGGKLYVISPSGYSLQASDSITYNPHNDLPKGRRLSVSTGGVSATSELSYGYDDLNRIVSLDRGGSAGALNYQYDMHGWIRKVSSGQYGEDIHYADGTGTPCYNGNISSLTWRNSDYVPDPEDNATSYVASHAGTIRGYRFAYDKCNRLTCSAYGETEDLSANTGRFDESMGYDLNGNITSISRNGLRQDGSYGTIDNLTIAHDGNQMSRAVDKAGVVNHVGSMDFANDADGGAVFGYDGNGALKYDSGRGIADIVYDLCGNPSRIQFTDGSVTRYVYTAEGEKLMTAHYTAMPNMSVAMGAVHILSDDEILSRDSDEYVCGGTVVLRNGSFYEYRTAEGFFRISGKAGGGKPAVTAYYFNKDHLGNVREVVGRDGTVCEVDNYYPFGMPYYEGASAQEHASFQQRKYCGKELDLVHGLNTYDHGVRQNYSVLGVWDRMDPLAEKYYNISPYAVCGNNPLFIMDSRGDSLTLLGTLSDINSAIDIYNKGLGGFYTVSANDNGNLSMQAVEGTDPSKMSSSQKAVFEKLQTIIDNEGNTILNVTNNSEETLIGDISKHEIDVGDMQKLENQKELNDVSSIMHETYENYQVQVLNSNINYAHRKASELEYRITGYFIPPFERDIETNSLKLHVLIPSDYYKYIHTIKNNIVHIK